MNIEFKEIMKILGKWYIWISFVFLILPGLLYQTDYRNIILSDYTGLSIIGLLMTSVYYSIPYILLAFLYTSVVVVNQKKKKILESGDLFLMSTYTLLFYWISDFVLHQKMGYTWIKSYITLAIILIIFLPLFYYIHKKTKGKKKK